MSIDKSLKQHYDSKYNIENRRRYFTGAYGGAGAGRGRDNGGGGNGSHDRGGQQHQRAAAPEKKQYK